MCYTYSFDAMKLFLLPLLLSLPSAQLSFAVYLRVKPAGVDEALVDADAVDPMGLTRSATSSK